MCLQILCIEKDTMSLIYMSVLVNVKVSQPETEWENDPSFAAFVYFHGANTPITADFKLPI